MHWLVVHQHLYQPPREDPWLELVPREASAAPDHDWNARITRECYARQAAAERWLQHGATHGPSAINDPDARAGLAQMLPLDETRRQETAVWLVGIQAAQRDPELSARLSRRYAAAEELLVAELRRNLAAAGLPDADDAELALLADEVLSAVDGVAVYALADPARYPAERQLALVDRVLDRIGL